MHSRRNKQTASVNKNTEQRAAFFRLHQNSFRKDLKVAFDQFLTVEKHIGFDVEFVGTGGFMDEDDLRVKYKSKAGRAIEIIKNTDKIVPGGECDVVRRYDLQIEKK